MALTLTDAIKEVQKLIKNNVSGIRQAPDYAPDGMPVYPFAIAFPGTGELVKRSAGFIEDIHFIQLEIHHTRTDLARSIATLTPMVEEVSDTLLDDDNATLNSTVQSINSITYEFGPLGFDNIDTIGYTFLIEVKI